MTEANTQAVVDETKAQPQAGAEVDSARTENDLESILKGFETETKTEQPQPVQPQATATDPKVAALEARQAALEAKSLNQDVRAAVTLVRGDLDPAIFDDALVKGWLNAKAESDPRVNNLFNKWRENPEAHTRQMKALGAEIAKKFSRLPDKEATEDRTAVAAAVRSASTKAPPETVPNYGAMNQADFAKELAKYS